MVLEVFDKGDVGGQRRRGLSHVNRLRRGFTLAEVAILLGIVAFVFGAVWIASDMVWRSYTRDKTLQQIFAIVNNVREVYAPIGQGTLPNNAGTADVTAILDGQRLVPIEMRVDRSNAAGNLRHALGGPVTLLAENTPSGIAQGVLRVTLGGLKAGNCVYLLMTLPATFPEVGMTRLAANSTHSVAIDPHNVTLPFTFPSGGGTASSFPLATATTWCDAANGVNNQVEFDFLVRN